MPTSQSNTSKRPQIKRPVITKPKQSTRPVIQKSKQTSKQILNSNGHRHANGRLKPGFPALAGAGAPLGSNNHGNGRLVKQAFTNELARIFKKKGRADTLQGLEVLAGKVITWAFKGSLPAAREVFDRVDGRPAQTIIGDPENPVYFKNVSDMTDEELEVVARGQVINGTAERVD